MDFFELKKTIDCLRHFLPGACITSVSQPDQRSLCLGFRAKHQLLTNNILHVSCDPKDSGLHLLPSNRLPMHAETLLARSFRKKLSGSIIQSIDMPFPDRIVILRFALAEWTAVRELWLEFQGSRSNATLIGSTDRVILECLTKIPDSSQTQPLRMPGRLFVSSWDHSMSQKRALETLLDDPGHWPDSPDPVQLASQLRSEFAPMTPLLSKNLARAKIQGDMVSVTRLLRSHIDTLKNIDHTNMEDALLYLTESGSQYIERIGNEDLERHKKRLEKIIVDARIRSEKIIRSLEQDRHNLPDPQLLRKTAELLAINHHRLRYGMDTIEVQDIYGSPPSKINIALDPKKSPAENVKVVFKRAAKAERAAPRIEKRMKMVRLEYDRLTFFKERIDAIRSTAECLDVEKQLTDAGFSPDKPLQFQRHIMLTAKPFLRFESPDGWSIWVGRNALENDRLSFREAAPSDFWLHAKGYRGAHVIIRNPQKLPSAPDQTIHFAAELAVRYSGAKGEKKVAVFVTMRKHIRRISGNRPGLVRVNRHETIVVNPE